MKVSFFVLLFCLFVVHVQSGPFDFFRLKKSPANGQQRERPTISAPIQQSEQPETIHVQDSSQASNAVPLQSQRMYSNLNEADNPLLASATNLNAGTDAPHGSASDFDSDTEYLVPNGVEDSYSYENIYTDIAPGHGQPASPYPLVKPPKPNLLSADEVDHAHGTLLSQPVLSSNDETVTISQASDPVDEIMKFLIKLKDEFLTLPPEKGQVSATYEYSAASQ